MTNFLANAGFRMPSSWGNWGSASDLYTSHAVSNFTHEHGLSVLSPKSPAHKLAENNMAMIGRFNNYVKEEIRNPLINLKNISILQTVLLQKTNRSIQIHMNNRIVLNTPF